MCGICGIVSIGPGGPPVDREELVRIRDRMAARGPDGSGLWMSLDGRVGLGHRRLSIIDLSPAADQPMSYSAGRYTIVFNGEIYNYWELREQLIAKGCSFLSNSDTEILLALFAQEGPRMLNRLRGMFALAIWDDKEKKLFLARDHFGIKPLYYSLHGGCLRFASQVRALLTGGAIPFDDDLAGLAGFWLLGYVPEPYTINRHIRALPAGQALWVNHDGAVEPYGYFNLTAEISVVEGSLPTSRCVEPINDRLHGLLRDAIRYHMVSDVPVGMFLSSGTDSSVIAALSSEHKKNLKAITLGFAEFKGKDCDEVPLAEKTARALRSDHAVRWISRSEFVEQSSALMEAMDQPSIDGINTYFVSRAAHQAGLKVALSGLGGDELCGGYPSFHDVPQIARRFNGCNRHPGLTVVVRKAAGPILRRFTSPKYAGLAEYGGSFGGAYLLRRGLFMPWELPELMGKDEAEQGLIELDLLSRLNKHVEPIRSPRLKVTALEISWYMKNQLLRDSDWAGMAHSLEIRVPWVDVDLFRSLLPEMARGDLNKNAMISTVADVLPPEIRTRKRTGFSVPIRDWLMAGGSDVKHKRGLRGWAGHVLESYGRTQQ